MRLSHASETGITNTSRGRSEETGANLPMAGAADLPPHRDSPPLQARQKRRRQQADGYLQEHGACGLGTMVGAGSREPSYGDEQLSVNLLPLSTETSPRHPLDERDQVKSRIVVSMGDQEILGKGRNEGRIRINLRNLFAPCLIRPSCNI